MLKEVGEVKNFDRIVSSAKSDYRIQSIINSYLERDGFQSHFVSGFTFKERKKDPPAFSIGAAVFRFPIGWICVSEGLLRMLSQEELEFVTLHELGHIIKNHSIGTFIVLLGKGFIVNWLADTFDLTTKKAKETLGLLKAIWMFFNKRTGTVEEDISARQELDADNYAVSHMNSREPAISVLAKLTKGEIRRPTHYTVDGKFVFPVITAEQRIETIRSSYFSSYGLKYSFPSF